MSDDPQDVAESLDEDRIDDDDDYAGDEVGESFPDYPPDRPMGVNSTGVTPVEEDSGESFAERTRHEIPEDARGDVDRGVGQLVDESINGIDDEEQLVADALPATELSAEEAAMHVEPE
jgi:hypothetical protein